ncbi:MAG: glycosyltransferase family 1 protein [Bryobacteraceae bacterium]
MAALRIGVNALYLIPGGVGGTEIYLRNLLQALAEIDRENQYFVFTNQETGADLVPAAANFVYSPQPVKATFRPGRLLFEQTGLPLAARRLKLDRIFNAGFTAPIIGPCRSVTVFHDLQHKRHPEHFRWYELPFWDMFLYGAAKRSDMLVAVSEATKQDLMRFYKLPSAKIRVAPHGVEQEFFEIQNKPDPADPYLLCVSTLHPHKNLERLIRVFGEFRRSCPEFRLVIAGLRGFHAEVLEKLADEHVRLTGWIPREELYGLFAGATGFIYPSTFEGFGMPVLEAMAAGVPLATSSIEPLVSIVHSSTVLFDPEDDAGMLAAMKLITSDPALRGSGRRRAAEFTWQAAARETLAAIIG